MNISFYTAAVGAQQQQDRLNIHANNMANVNTFGFRPKRPAFASLMTGPLMGIEEDLPRGVGARLESAEAVVGGDNLKCTNQAMDYAINGDGFFVLLDAQEQTYTFTRDGSFTMSDFMVPRTDENGNPVLDENGEQIRDQVWYLSDGRGRYVLGQDGAPIELSNPSLGLPEPVGIFDFDNYNGMNRTGSNDVVSLEKNGPLRVGTGKLIQGYVELSNTDVGQEIAKVIESQRSFSYMLRMVTTSDEIETTVNGLR